MESFNPVLRHLYLQLLKHSGRWRIECSNAKSNTVLISLYRNEIYKDCCHQYVLSNRYSIRYYFGWGNRGMEYFML